MVKKLLPLFLLCQLLFLQSCQNTLQKCQTFVSDYNQSATMFTSSIVYHTEAKLEEDKIPKEHIINIDLEYTLKKEEAEKEFTIKSIPKIITSKLVQENQVKKLIEDGVQIVLYFRSFDNFILDKITINKETLHNIQTDYSKSKNSTTLSDNKNKELQEILGILNSQLPSEIEKDFTKLLKIELNDQNNLIYVVEISQEYERLLKTDEAKEFLKESLVRDKNVKKLMALKSQFSINEIICRYQSIKGKNILEFPIQ